MKKAFSIAAAVLAASLFLACIVEIDSEGTGFEVTVDFGARSVADDVKVTSVLVKAYDPDDNLLDEDTLTEKPWKAFLSIDPTKYGGILFTAQALGSGESVLYSGELAIVINGDTSKSLSITVSARDYISSTIGTLKYVPSGSFQRDATATNISEITQAYRMSAHEITRAQFAAMLTTDPSNPTYSTTDTTNPVQSTNWYHAIAFCNKLSLAEGLDPVYSVTVSGTPVDWEALTYAQIPPGNDTDWNEATATWSNNGYRLPTEMEWMWAAMGAPADGRSGGTNTTGYAKAFAGSTGSNAIGAYAVYDYYGSSAGRTLTERSNPVGSKLTNELGLYDMSGNVWEWTWDRYATYPTGTQPDYRGAASGTIRVNRGGSWGNGATYCPVAYRGLDIPGGQYDRLGFRVVRP